MPSKVKNCLCLVTHLYPYFSHRVHQCVCWTSLGQCVDWSRMLFCLLLANRCASWLQAFSHPTPRWSTFTLDQHQELYLCGHFCRGRSCTARTHVSQIALQGCFLPALNEKKALMLCILCLSTEAQDERSLKVKVFCRVACTRWFTFTIWCLCFSALRWLSLLVTAASLDGWPLSPGSSAAGSCVPTEERGPSFSH